MTALAILLGKWGMQSHILALFFQGLMTGETQPAASRTFFQEILSLPLMRRMATAAFSVGKRGMQTEAAHFAGAFLMAGKTQHLFAFHQQISLARFMGFVAVQTLAPCGRRMGNGARTVHFFLMTGVAELGWVEKEQRRARCAVPGMTGETLPFGKWIMAAFYLTFFSARVTADTYLFRRHGQHGLILAGMGGMALQAIPLFIRLMEADHFPLVLMAGDTSCVRIALQLQFPGSAGQMAGGAIAVQHRLVHDGL